MTNSYNETEMLDEATLSELERMEKEATPGPWRLDVDWTYEIIDANDAIIGKVVQASEDHDRVAEAALIVALRNAAPSLFRLARLGLEAEKLLESAQAELGNCEDHGAFADDCVRCRICGHPKAEHRAAKETP